MVVEPSALGVKVAVYVVPVPENELILPPVTVISVDTKLLVDSPLIKVTVKLPSFVVEPLFIAVPPLFAAVMAMAGAAPSITKALFAPSEFVAPGDGRVNVAAFPDVSVMVPPFRVKAFVLE
tara:strand:- start:51 stop:416 length:366 start_codon:yes stop_codon:yes gene_type:complete